jgi:ribokinase
VDVFHGGCVGKTDGQLLTDELLSVGVNIDNVLPVDTRSGNAIIQVDSNGENSIVLFGGANQCVTPNQIEQSLLSFGKDDILLLQNEINNISLIMNKASELGMTIVLNPAPYNEDIHNLPLHLVDIFILNEIEGRDIINYEGVCTEELMVALCKEFPRAEVVLTLGESGVRYFDGSDVFFQKAFEVPVVDTTAAGDTFTGFFLAGLVDSKTSSQRIEVASMAAAIAVSRMGASSSIPTMEEVRKGYHDS